MEYFAPEVIRKTGYDKSIDFWAVGCMIYKMLFGISPFHHKNRNQLMQKIQYKEPVFPDRATYGLQYSDQVVDLIQKLLSKDKN